MATSPRQRTTLPHSKATLYAQGKARTEKTKFSYLILFFLSKFLFCNSIAAACWTTHYAKRLLETVFVHRFSHSTMPIMNLFKNCAYYWGFTAYVAYHVSHPLYTSPSSLQVYTGLAGFLVSISSKGIDWTSMEPIY